MDSFGFPWQYFTRSETPLTYTLTDTSVCRRTSPLCTCNFHALSNHNVEDTLSRVTCRNTCHGEAAAPVITKLFLVCVLLPCALRFVSAVTSLLPVNRMFLCPVVSLHLTDVHLSIVPPHFLSSCSCYSILEPDFLPWCHLSSSVTAGIILFVLVPLAMAGRPSFHPWYCDTHCFTCRHTFSSVDIFSTCSTSSCASPSLPGHAQPATSKRSGTPSPLFTPWHPRRWAEAVRRLPSHDSSLYASFIRTLILSNSFRYLVSVSDVFSSHVLVKANSFFFSPCTQHSQILRGEEAGAARHADILFIRHRLVGRVFVRNRIRQ